MEQEFKIKKGWRIFGYMFGVIVIIIALYFGVDAILRSSYILLWITINLVSILLFGYWFVAIYRGKVVLRDDSIIEYRVFGKKKLLFSEVKGYKIRGQKIILEPRDKKRSRMFVGDFNYTINGSDLATFLTTKFKDIDESDYNIEASGAFNNPAIGDSVAEHEQRIKAAKKIARYLNIGGFVVMILFGVPSPYNYHVPIIILGLLYPLIVLMYFFIHQQILTLVEIRKQSVYPNLMVALLFPVGGLGVRLINQYLPLNISDCILPVALLAIVLMLLFISLLRQSKARKSKLWMGLFFCLVYSASAIGMINCTFDYSRPVEYKVKVLDHWILQRPTSYNIKLDTWALRKEPTVETVPRTTYNHIKNGDQVTVYIKKVI